MNPQLDRLVAYPFERLNAMKQGVVPNSNHPHVALSIGEPKHPPPAFVVDVLANADALATDLAIYPITKGGAELREAIAGWVARRFAAPVDPEREVLPVAGTREALFSFGQAVLSGRPGSLGLLPNPFYQIYEGAVLLGGAEPYFLDCTRANDYLPDYRAVPAAIWDRCELLFVCSPGNPTGRVLPVETLRWLIEQAQRHDFVIAADECYSEIHAPDAAPPPGLLEVARGMGLRGYDRCVAFHSLSKRSNLPGLRSGFVAGDAAILERYLLYRTYQGCALGNHVQRASVAAWSDEAHVVANRRLYAEKFAAITPVLERAFTFREPEGGFYHWLEVHGDDVAFARELYRAENIAVLPGSFLSRVVRGVNPGAGHVRVAWVAELPACVSAAERLADWALARKRTAE